MQQGIFHPESTIIADSYSVHTAPVCNHMHQQPYQCLDTQKYCTDILHALIGMGSTALAAAVVLPRYGGLNYACGINKDLSLIHI